MGVEELEETTKRGRSENPRKKQVEGDKELGGFVQSRISARGGLDIL